MHKFYKQRLYKKYNDEIWGRLISSKKFSYNKKSVLLSYRDKVVKNWLGVRTKYSYHRRGFLQHLKETAYQYKNVRKRFRILNFLFKGILVKSTLPFTFKSRRIKRIRRFRFKFKNKKRFSLMRRKKYKFYRKIIIRRTRVLFIKKGIEGAFRKNKALALLKINLNTLPRFFSFGKLPFLINRKMLLGCEDYRAVNFPNINNSKSHSLYRMVNFLRKSNMQYIVKKKLNLRRQKAFFYSVHVAAPRKKKKKWSLFALKNIYYKKVSLFFGFKKVSTFFKLYNQVVSVWGKNQFQLFLMLEGRLENILLRLNFFSSIYFIKRFIESGNVFVNNKTITYSSYFLNYNEIVSIEKRYFKLVYYFLKSKLKSKKILLNVPSFIEADYKLLVAMLIRSPAILDLTRPVSFNLYTKFLSFNR